MSVLSSLSPTRALLGGFLHLTCWLRILQGPLDPGAPFQISTPSLHRTPPLAVHPSLCILAQLGPVSQGFTLIPACRALTCTLFKIQPLFKMPTSNLALFQVRSWDTMRRH